MSGDQPSRLDRTPSVLPSDPAAEPPPDTAPLAAPRATSSRRARPHPRRAPADTVGDELPEERIAEIRRRIAAGVYDSREVLDEVARRLVESGDV